MKKLFLSLGFLSILLSPAIAITQFEGGTNRGGVWKKQGSSLVFVGDRLNGTVLNSNMSVKVKLDGKSISGCKAVQSRSNPKGLRLICTGDAPNSSLNQPDGLGVFTN